MKVPEMETSKMPEMKVPEMETSKMPEMKVPEMETSTGIESVMETSGKNMESVLMGLSKMETAQDRIIKELDLYSKLSSEDIKGTVEKINADFDKSLEKLVKTLPKKGKLIDFEKIDMPDIMSQLSGLEEEKLNKLKEALTEIVESSPKDVVSKVQDAMAGEKKTGMDEVTTKSYAPAVEKGTIEGNKALLDEGKKRDDTMMKVAKNTFDTEKNTFKSNIALEKIEARLDKDPAEEEVFEI